MLRRQHQNSTVLVLMRRTKKKKIALPPTPLCALSICIEQKKRRQQLSHARRTERDAHTHKKKEEIWQMALRRMVAISQWCYGWQFSGPVYRVLTNISRSGPFTHINGMV